MPTREVLNQFEASSAEAKGEGPLQGPMTDAPQSLITMHECLAARPNAQPCSSHYHDGRLQPDQDRVRSTGARTPGSLAREIQAQVIVTKARRESEAKENRGKQDAMDKES
ncbi:hypothetical protein FZEAL_2395 [Fusarium zealandicum]|uniref:Uncharacterized protein n=1 Tax=Fusarium zealandicum TaxID=1053134 RepID=A0A8H4XNM6_9HYPO|nr:hypothetical protein FZEAL_2395 [Fusarium zealandicum]